jgi:hypothetical protein
MSRGQRNESSTAVNFGFLDRIPLGIAFIIILPYRLQLCNPVIVQRPKIRGQKVHLYEFGALTAVIMKIGIRRNATPYNLVDV